MTTITTIPSGKACTCGGVDGLKDRIDELEADVARLKAEREWMPIESAPMDGRRIQLCDKIRLTSGDIHVVTDGWWDDSYDCWYHFHCEEDEFYSVAVKNPISWMPLPPPPESEQ